MPITTGRTPCAGSQGRAPGPSSKPTLTTLMLIHKPEADRNADLLLYALPTPWPYSSLWVLHGLQATASVVITLGFSSLPYIWFSRYLNCRLGFFSWENHWGILWSEKCPTVPRHRRQKKNPIKILKAKSHKISFFIANTSLPHCWHTTRAEGNTSDGDPN